MGNAGMVPNEERVVDILINKDPPRPAPRSSKGGPLSFFSHVGLTFDVCHKQSLDDVARGGAVGRDLKAWGFLYTDFLMPATNLSSIYFNRGSSYI